MKRILLPVLYSLALLFSGKAEAQLIKPMGKGLKYPAVDIYVDSSQTTILALQIVSVNQDSLFTEYLISKWNGSSWQDECSVTLRRGLYALPNCVTALAVYKGDIYLGGHFNGIASQPNVSGDEGLIRWNGSSWSGVNLTIPGAEFVTALETMGGKLFVATSKLSYYLQRFDGSNWSYVDSSYTPDGQVSGMKAYKGKLIITGRFLKPVEGITIWDEAAGNFLPYPGHLGFNWFGDIVPETDTSFFVGFTSEMTQVKRMAYYGGATVRETLYPMATNHKDKIYSSIKSAKRHHMALVDGRLWLSVATSDTTGDIYFLESNRFVRFPSEALGYFYGPPRLVALGDSLLLVGKFKRHGSTLLDYVGVVTDVPRVIRVYGKVFYDATNNCVADSTDKGLKKIKLKAEPGYDIAETDKDGNYDFLLANGTYSIKLLNPPKSTLFYCTSDTLMADSNVTERNFPLKWKPGFRNSELKLISNAGWSPIKGWEQILFLKVENKSALPDTLTVVLNYDTSKGWWVGCDSTPLNHMGNKVSFLARIPGFDEVFYQVKLKTDSMANVGHTIIHIAYMDSVSALRDSVSEGNSDTLEQVIRGPRDPNDKQAWPASALRPDTKKVSYHIRFQNVGSAPAMKVRVVDSIDSNLSLESVEVQQASHQYRLYIEKNVLTWVFDDIYLMDSASNEAASKGFITYTASLKDGLPIGTKIRNTAYIYFDWEEPVITNTVVNTIENWGQSVKAVTKITETLKLYPNPAYGQVTIENTAQAPAQLRLLDVLGRIVWEGQVGALNKIGLSTNEFADGIYVLCSENGPAIRLVIAH